MKGGQSETMQTTPVRIDNDILDLVRDHKTATGFPIGRFIEDAIVLKVSMLEDSVKLKMGLTPLKPKKATNKKSK
jgi:hypothetical protein